MSRTQRRREGTFLRAAQYHFPLAFCAMWDGYRQLVLGRTRAKEVYLGGTTEWS